MLHKLVDVPSSPASQILRIDAEKVKDRIKRLKPNKAPGHNSIDGKVAKALPASSISFLTLVINAMIVLNFIRSRGIVRMLL